IERGVAALRRMRQVAEIHEAELVAVATSAVREAENARDFLTRAQDDAGVTVEVITGLEEARLIYLGVLQALPVYDQTTLLVDIILGGAVILEQAMIALGIDQMTVSDYALREGVLLDALQRRRGSARHHLSDLRRRSVEHLADLMDDDRAHSTNVARLALDLF